jgi:hypothetical protein
VTTRTRASRGSIAGSSGDGGVEYRRGVAAHAVALGLAGAPLPGLEVPPAHAQVRAVTLETEDAVDDIRIDFTSGWTALVQAKRSLRRGSVLKKAVEQWAEAGKGTLDPTKDRLVLVAGNLSGPMKDLQRVLNRGRLAIPGAPTKQEAAILEHVVDLLDGLSTTQRSLVLKCAVIWELAVEEPQDSGAQQAISHLRGIVAGGKAADAHGAWKSLVDIAGQAARRRGGHDLPGWFAALHGEGTTIRLAGGAPAAELENIRQAVARYSARLTREGRLIDLRGLGAQIPALAAEEADAGVKVSIDPDDRAASELLWAFMRRGRLVLTGLPGGGKSTSIKKLAAQLCTLPGAPMPVRVSLREVDALDHAMSFRDRLIAAAIRDDKADDRALLRREIERRLDKGAIALLLDSLDETYDHRAIVVGEIVALLAEASPDVDVLLATRDVAYGHAATLGWPSLRLRAPEAIEKVVRAILRAAAAQRTSTIPSEEDWVAERVEWVESVLTRESILRETPLVPVLLAILTVERSLAALPTQRVGVLAAVVQDVVARHELKREDGKTLGPLTGSELDTAAMHAFTGEAAAILNNNGQVSVETAVHVIAGELTEQWGLHPGYASVAARDAVHFFDESGIFVISGAERTVAPRIGLFAEIGDALRIATRPKEVDSWVAARISGAQMEPLILAAALSVEVAASLASAMAKHIADQTLVHATVRAFAEGANFDDTAIRFLSEALIAEVATGTREGWLSWQELLSLPVPEDLRNAAEVAAGQHGPAHAQVARAALDLRFNDEASLIRDPEALFGVLTLSDLPSRPPEDPSAGHDIRFAGVDEALIDTQLSAAETLLGHVPAATGLVAERAANAPRGLRRSLVQLLLDRGFNEEARGVQEASKWPGLTVPDWLSAFKDGHETHIVTMLAAGLQAELTYPQATRLDDLADFVETLDLNDASAGHLLLEPDEVLGALIETTESLYGFDANVLAAQAQVVLDRVASCGDSDPYYSLFDAACERKKPDWDAVANPETAVDLLLHLFSLGRAQARFAMKSLWGAPVSHIAAPLLRELLPDLVSSPYHERLAAYTLCTLAEGPEPECWVHSEDPVLRAVAAETIQPTSGNALSEDLRQLLNDPDGYVQQSALKRVAAISPPDIEAILSEAANRPRPGWMCLSCRSVNPRPGQISCLKDGCLRVGADPAKVAAELLAEHTHPSGS